MPTQRLTPAAVVLVVIFNPIQPGRFERCWAGGGGGGAVAVI